MHTPTPTRSRRRRGLRTLFAATAAIALFGVGAVTLGTGSAAASGSGDSGFNGPTITHPGAAPETYTAGEVCSFPVKLTFPVNKVVQKTWTDDAGNPVFAVASGLLVARATNLDTGRSTVADLDGTGNYSYLPDGSLILSGNGGILVGDHTGDNPPNELLFSQDSASSYISVRIATVNGQSVKTILELEGPHTNLCQVLATH